MTLTIGIDPGLSVAIAAINPNGSIELHDCPTLTVGRKTTYNPVGMAMLLRRYQESHTPLLVALEKVHAMPRQGVASTFVFAEGYGVWLGILASLNLPHELITPQSWKKSMMNGQAKEKDASRLVAMRLFPEVGNQLQLKKHHGRADALLIAEFLRRRAIAPFSLARATPG
jgi:Holliday junction resolvasome RuvABC endonuclease subunit